MSGSDDALAIDPLSSFPATPGARLARWWRRRGRREIAREEYAAELTGTRLRIDFHCERLPGSLLVTTPPHSPARVTSLRVRNGEGLTPLRARVQRREGEDGHQDEIDLLDRVPTLQLEIHLEPSPEAGLNLQMWVHGEDPDLASFRLAREALDQDKNRLALQRFLDFETRHTHLNPQSALGLAQAHQRLKEPAEAAHHALRAFAGGAEDPAWMIYQTLQGELHAPDHEAIRRLQEEAADWPGRSHQGIVVLDRIQRVVIAREGWSLTEIRERIEIRRRAAARLLRSLDFGLDAERETLMHTALRVLHDDDTFEEVPLDNFSLGDSADRNPFITVESRKTGHWILPDLEPGDVIEWSHHTLTRHHAPRQPARFFVTAFPFHGREPTFRAETEFLAPAEVRPRFAGRRLDREPEETDREGSWRAWRLRGERFLPVTHTGYLYEASHLRPLVAVSAEEDSWPDVARRGREMSFGATGGDDPLPGPLEEVVAAGNDPDRALELAYYWIRDRLKYASTATGERMVGQPERARHILETGTADCKDKSYLLGLVARHLELRHEFVAVSAGTGLLLPELPAQQFDHVFVRVEVDGAWRYLDATNQLGTYGRVPVWLQGTEAMLVDEAGSVFTLPVDPPEENRVRIRETFTAIEDSWLRGNFEFEATGHPGRMVGESLKVSTLSLSDGRRSVQQVVEQYLPYLVLRDHELVSDTGSSDVFRMTGRHERCQLLPLGDHGPAVGRLHWNAFLHPFNWRSLVLDGFYAQDVNCRLDIELRLEGEVAERLADFSRAEPLENGICRVHEEVARDGGGLVVHRRIEVRERIIEGDRMALLDPAFAAMESASTLVLSFDREPRGPGR